MNNDQPVLSNIGPYIREIEVIPDPAYLPQPIRKDAPATAPVEAPVREAPILPSNPDDEPGTPIPQEVPVKDPEKVPA